MTGTPINRGLEDLFGLLAFLRADPWGERSWWLRVCQRPYEAGCAAGGLASWPYGAVVNPEHLDWLLIVHDLVLFPALDLAIACR